MACAGISETCAGRAWVGCCCCCCCGAGAGWRIIVGAGVVAVVGDVDVVVDALNRRFFLPKGHSGMAIDTRSSVDWAAAYATLDDVYDQRMDGGRGREGSTRPSK